MKLELTMCIPLSMSHILPLSKGVSVIELLFLSSLMLISPEKI
jgi:hypothetical protein